jgi:type IV pilus assembly protein PilM
MAQAQWVENDWRLIAAASAEVPPAARREGPERWAFFTQTARDLLLTGGFTGRSAMLGLPAASMFIQHLRMPKLDDDELKKALPWEARGKLPMDLSHAVLRHIVAGEVYVDQEARSEVILLATHNQTVEQLLSCSAKAKLDVVGMNIEPMAVLDCFTQVYRRNVDAATTNFFVDIGAAGTRAIFTRGRQILFARAIPIGGDHFTSATAEALKHSREEAKALRMKLCKDACAAGERGSIWPGQNSGDPSSPRLRVEQACAPAVGKLIEELDLCRRYYDATFPAKPIDRLIFIGGEAKQRGICQRIAAELNLPAQIGDPLCRLGKRCDAGVESGIDRRQPQPAWAVAIGLSMGPPTEQSAAAGESRSTNERA